MSKALVFVLVPYSINPGQISEYADRLLQPHAMLDDRSSGWYDYLCHPGSVFNDPVTEGGLPNRQKQSLHRCVCDISRLPPQPLPNALVTPNGTWHACEPYLPDYYSDRGLLELAYSEALQIAAATWSTRYHELLAAHPYCWVIAILAHS